MLILREYRKTENIESYKKLKEKIIKELNEKKWNTLAAKVIEEQASKEEVESELRVVFDEIAMKYEDSSCKTKKLKYVNGNKK